MVCAAQEIDSLRFVQSKWIVLEIGSVGTKAHLQG